MNLTTEPVVEVDHLVRKFGNRTVIDDLSFTIHRGETLVIMGGSGCGKSTLLRCFNRMNDLIDGARVTAGSIRIEGVDINAPEIDVVDLRRRVGMVFQKSNPFPKSIYDNIAYGLRIAGIAKRSRIDEAVDVLSFLFLQLHVS